METEKSNLYSRYKQDADACKHGYYGYELWLENKLIEAETKLKKLRVTDVSVSFCDFVWHNSDIVTNLKCRECGSSVSQY